MPVIGHAASPVPKPPVEVVNEQSIDWKDILEVNNTAIPELTYHVKQLCVHLIIFFVSKKIVSTYSIPIMYPIGQKIYRVLKHLPSIKQH